MIAALVILGMGCGWLLLQHIRSVLEIRSLCRQLEELERGSHMEMGVQSRQRDMLELCRKLNRLQKLHHQEQIQYERAERQLKQNITGLAHDIRTPLTSIVGSTSTVLENPSLPRAEQEALLEDVRSEAQWLIRAVENLLSITRMGDGQTHITKNVEAAEEILGEAVRKFRRRSPNIHVSVEPPQELLLVPMDAILMEQVLANLMENAAVHGETTTHIRLSVRSDDSFARFTVADNGRGISAAALSTLFDGTLKQSESAKGDGKRNMGLGLSVCMAIVRAHGGTMEARNLETGAEFSFRLPLLKEDPNK